MWGRKQGAGVALEALGVAYSSLAQLRRLPLNLLRLDRSHVVCLGNHPEDNTVLAAMIDLSHASVRKLRGHHLAMTVAAQTRVP